VRLNILLSGTGGQGVVLAGELLSRALFKAGYEVVNTHSYGAEARGGACRSEVLVSDEEIYDLSLTEADVLIAMSTPAYRRYISRVRNGGTVILDSAVAEELERLGVDLRSDVETITVPARRVAEELGYPIVANMVLIGALVKRSRLIDLEVVKKLVEEEMRPSMREINIRALEAGYSSLPLKD